MTQQTSSVAGVSIIARPVIFQAFDQSKLHDDAAPSLCYASLSLRVLGSFPTFIDRAKAWHWSHRGFTLILILRTQGEDEKSNKRAKVCPSHKQMAIMTFLCKGIDVEILEYVQPQIFYATTDISEGSYLRIPTRSADLSNLIRLTMRNDALFDLECFDNVFPSFVV